MNEFIEVTNKVLKEKLKDKICISSISYYILYGIITIKIIFYTKNFKEKSISYAYSLSQDIDNLELEFSAFIDKNFNI